MNNIIYINNTNNNIIITNNKHCILDSEILNIGYLVLIIIWFV